MPDSRSSHKNSNVPPFQSICDESIYRKALSLSSECIHVCVRRGADPFRLVWLEGAVAGVTGFSRKELLTKECWYERVHPDDAHAVAALLARLSSGDTGEVVYRLVRKDGSACRVCESYRCEAGDAPGEMLLYSATRMISGSSPDAVEATSLAFPGRIQEGFRAERMNAALAELSNALWVEQDLESYCRKVHTVFESALGAKNFFIGLVDEQADMVRFPYFADAMDGPCFSIPEMSPPSKATPTLHVLRTGKPALFSKKSLLQRVESGEFRTSLGTRPEVWLGVPLIVHGKPIGVLGVQDYADPYLFSSKDVSLLTSAAGLIGVAIQRNRAELDLKDSADRLSLAAKGGRIGLWDLDLPSGRVIYSHIWGEILGYSTRDIPDDYTFWESRIHPEDKNVTLGRLQDHLEGRAEIFEQEHRLKAKDGRWVWVLGKGRSKAGMPQVRPSVCLGL